jgi:hypothetical protein
MPHYPLITKAIVKSATWNSRREVRALIQIAYYVVISSAKMIGDCICSRKYKRVVHRYLQDVHSICAMS